MCRKPLSKFTPGRECTKQTNTQTHTLDMILVLALSLSWMMFSQGFLADQCEAWDGGGGGWEEGGGAGCDNSKAEDEITYKQFPPWK